MTQPLETSLNARRQNAHLTFKNNRHHGRHGWLRLTPAYSVSLVGNILNGHKHITTVLDPFSGTGTTALSAAYRGLTGTGLEINPFLVWFSSIKFRKYSTDTIEKTQSLGDEIADTTSSSELTVDPPPIHNIERWWNKRELYFLCRLKACILDTTDDGSPERDLLLATFCRVVILLSNAAFNHQSMSFKNVNHAPTLFEIKRDFPDVFRTELSIVLNGAMDNPCIEPTVVTGDARQPSRFLNNTYDMIITSPPYPNRMSYIRELRPYMYWMDFLTNGRDAGEFDWQAIGGTWGIATSRLAEWEPGGNYFIPGSLEKSLKGISDPRNDNGRLMANYVAKYFEDMWRHISDVSTILNPDSEIHYIVGNSTFYNTLLPVEEIFKSMLQEADFHDVKIIKLRKRNSKKELFEFDVMGKRNS